MSVTDGENGGSGPEVVHLTLRGYDPFDPSHVTQLAKLFASYLIEEFERTGTAPLGLPVALYLHTLTLWDGDGLVAFCSIDSDRYAVELVYVDPHYRRHGLAEDLYRRIKASCPIPLHVKGPLSPAGQALADRVGLPVDNCPDDEVAHAAQVDAELHQTMAASCKHKHGNPARGCNRCYRAAMRKTAVVLVGQHALACQLLHEGRAFLL